MKIKGKYGSAILYATYIDDVTKAQVLELMNQRFVEKSNVRIMADCHAGAGCVIGTTMTITDKVVPNLVGVDIGCAVTCCITDGKINPNEYELIEIPYYDCILGKEITRKLPSGKEVTFNINGVFYKRQTNASGIVNLNLNLNPGNYIITAEYRNCKVSNTVSILPILRANDITMSYMDGTSFKVYLVDGTGKPKAYDSVVFNINGVFYKRTTNEDGIAKLKINLQPGEYIITSESNYLSIANKIIIHAHEKTEKEIIKNTTFTYEINLPNYVNVTFPYVFENSAYSIKSGINGIIRMEKNQLFGIQIGNKTHVFATGLMPEYSAKYLGSEYWLLPFDNSAPQHSYKFENLTGNGIILQRSSNYTHIIYRNNCSSNIEQFGAYIDKFIDAGADGVCFHVPGCGT